MRLSASDSSYFPTKCDDSGKAAHDFLVRCSAGFHPYGERPLSYHTSIQAFYRYAESRVSELAGVLLSDSAPVVYLRA
jgi:hypothetical protein